MEKSALHQLIEKCIEYKNMFSATGTKSQREIRGTYTNVIMIANDLLETQRIDLIEAEKRGVNTTIKLFEQYLKSDDCFITDKDGNKLPDAILDGKNMSSYFSKYIETLK